MKRSLSTQLQIQIASWIVALALPTALGAQSLGEFAVTKMAEKAVTELPAGELYWHVETFGSLDQARSAENSHSLSAEFDGKYWLFTLADRKMGGNGGTKVASIGPIARVDATEFLLRINSATAPTGSKTKVHTHPGPEAFLILSGQLTQRTPHGQHVLNAGGTMPGVPDQAMEVASTGEEELRELIMFVVDGSRPFAEDAQLD